LKSFVNRVALPTIFFADPVRKIFFVPLDNIDATVGASTVDDDVFEVRIVLFQDRYNGFLEKLRMVIARGYTVILGMLPTPVAFR